MNPANSPFPLTLGEVTVECGSFYYGLIDRNEATHELNIYQETTTIPLVDDQCFGIEFALLTASRLESGLEVDLHFEISYPNLTAPDTRRVKRRSFKPELNTYTFVWQKLDTPEEMAPGRWTVSVLYADHVLLTQDFDVVAGTD